MQLNLQDDKKNEDNNGQDNVMPRRSRFTSSFTCEVVNVAVAIDEHINSITNASGNGGCIS